MEEGREGEKEGLKAKEKRKSSFEPMALAETSC